MYFWCIVFSFLKARNCKIPSLKKAYLQCFGGGSSQSENTLLHNIDVEIIAICWNKYWVIGNSDKYLLKGLVPLNCFKFRYCLKLFRKNIPTAKILAVCTEIKFQGSFHGFVHTAYRYFPLTFYFRVKSNLTHKTFSYIRWSSK